MAPSPDQIANEQEDVRPSGRVFGFGRAAMLLIILLLALVVFGWIQREQIARDLIGEQLAALDLPATYVIDDIDTNRQILTNIVVGDPDRPDLTIDKLVVELVYGFGIPEIGKVTVVNPRLYGSLRDGKLSFGALDPILFESNDEAAGLPDIDLVLNDGRALIETGFGDIGVKLEGAGLISDGFTGTLAAIAPTFDVGPCRLQRASAFGQIAIDKGAIELGGPVRIASFQCDSASVSGAAIAWQSKLRVPQDFSGVEGAGQFEASAVDGGFAKLGKTSGPLSIALRQGNLVADFDLALAQLTGAQFSADTLSVDGSVRTGENFAQLQTDLNLTGAGISAGSSAPDQLRGWALSAKDTLFAPVLTKLASAVETEVRNTQFSGSLIGRVDGQSRSVIMPEAMFRLPSGASLLSLSQLQYRQQNAGTPRISGNFRVGGRNLPRIVGRMEGTGAGDAVLRLKMQPYTAASSSVEIPEVLLTQSVSGALTFAGSVVASGPLPGGAAQNLRIPVQGKWNNGTGLALWQNCTAIGFDTLAYANLELARRSVTLCPAPGRSIVRYAAGKLAIAAGLPNLDLAGSLAGTPITVKSGPIGFAYPGIATARQVAVQLGPRDAPSKFVISDLLANLGDDIAGTFEGADISIAAVPLELGQTTGVWAYQSGVLTINQATFTLSDRNPDYRFEPLPVTDGALVLEDNMITANATVRAPTDPREVAKVSLRHDLTSGTGFSDLSVDGLRFDDGLQPTDLTPLALGVVANVEGTVTGTGRIDWTSDLVSSFGKFSSNSLDLAAAFGPVKGASGTIKFVDLLSLTTAPDQQVNVASVNPGIEAKNGVIGFSLREGQFLGVTGGKWPFMGGTLYLRPVDLNLGVAEKRRYVLEVEEVDAALFVENLELGNIAANGIFDGALPLVFDEQGFGRIEGGLLRSRDPGGNVSYIGELTYEDLSPIANYTFQTLRSLDYDVMRIEMDGPLTGDIVTRLKFQGVKQGAGTKQNFITRQIANLPIQLNVNITAPFYQLFSSLKSIYDPAAVRDPRELGLLTDDGERFIPATRLPPQQPILPETNLDKPQVPPNPPIAPNPEADALRPNELSIQPLDSEEMP